MNRTLFLFYVSPQYHVFKDTEWRMKINNNWIMAIDSHSMKYYVVVENVG